MVKKTYIEDIEHDLKQPNKPGDIPAPVLPLEEALKDPIYKDLYEILKKNIPPDTN